jgi:hypothetical protein
LRPRIESRIAPCSTPSPELLAPALCGRAGHGLLRARHLAFLCFTWIAPHSTSSAPCCSPILLGSQHLAPCAVCRLLRSRRLAPVLVRGSPRATDRSVFSTWNSAPPTNCSVYDTSRSTPLADCSSLAVSRFAPPAECSVLDAWPSVPVYGLLRTLTLCARGLSRGSLRAQPRVPHRHRLLCARRLTLCSDCGLLRSPHFAPPC